MLKKIRIQRVSIFDIVATLVLAVVLVAFAVQGTGELAQMQTATDDYIQCETLARQLQSGSDYLIEQVAARGLQGRCRFVQATVCPPALCLRHRCLQGRATQ